MSENSNLKKVRCPICQKLSVERGINYPVNFLEKNGYSILVFQRYECTNSECITNFFIVATYDKTSGNGAEGN